MKFRRCHDSTLVLCAKFHNDWFNIKQITDKLIFQSISIVAKNSSVKCGFGKDAACHITWGCVFACGATGGGEITWLLF